MNNLKPQQIIILSFILVIIIGTSLLTLPFAVTDNKCLSITDALFTATSATCVTGLIVVDTGTKFSLFGQSVILGLIQIGGLGFMTMSTFFVLLLKKKLTLKDKIIIEESILQYPTHNFRKMLGNIILLVFIFELIGTLILYFRFKYYYNFDNALWSAVFHSISAFCNAGFSIYSDSLIQFSSDIVIIPAISFLIISGGLGFIVIVEIKDFVIQHKWKNHLPNFSFYSKIVLITTTVLLLTGFILIFIFEYNTGFAEKSLKEKILLSMFHSVTPRTAGFNSINMNNLSLATLFITIIFMFIGGSSGSTAGGIKTGTIFVLFSYLKSLVQGKQKNFIFKRKISISILKQAYSVFFLSTIIVIIALLILCNTENVVLYSDKNNPFNFMNILFETFSAFGTVGLSLGITPVLTEIGKIIITILMFIGRLGPVIIAYTIFTKKEEHLKYDYPEENILIG